MSFATHQQDESSQEFSHALSYQCTPASQNTQVQHDCNQIKSHKTSNSVLSGGLSRLRIHDCLQSKPVLLSNSRACRLTSRLNDNFFIERTSVLAGMKNTAPTALRSLSKQGL